MTIDELFKWGYSHHYPQLVLSEQDVLRHGQSHWHTLTHDTQERRDAVCKRVEQWQRYESRERIA